MVVGEFYEVQVFDGFGGMCVWLSMGAPSIHKILGLIRAMHVHV